MSVSATHRAINAVWRIESARIIAGLARIVRDVGLAEDLAQDALVAALEQWPKTGVPDNPGAWLMASAKYRAIDRLRRSKLEERKHEELGRELESRWKTALKLVLDPASSDLVLFESGCRKLGDRIELSEGAFIFTRRRSGSVRPGRVTRALRHRSSARSPHTTIQPRKTDPA